MQVEQLNCYAEAYHFGGATICMMLCEIGCCSCGYSVPLRPEYVCRIALEERGSPEKFVDWVCPQCGTGRRFNVSELQRREFTSATKHYQVPVFHAFLRCTVERCAAHATVHTLAENGHPRLPIGEWKSVTARCYDGHPARVPLNVTRSTLTHDVE